MAPTTKRKTIEVVVQAEDGGASLLFDHEGNVHVAGDPAELGRWLAELGADETVPGVAFGKPSGRWTELVSRVLEQNGIGPVKRDDAAAVHLVVQFTFDGDDLANAVVHPQAGRMRLARDTAALGQLADAFARDDAQPKVPGGAPPDAFGDLVERGTACLGEVL